MSQQLRHFSIKNGHILEASKLSPNPVVAEEFSLKHCKSKQFC